jgi:hypothetical protein
MFTTEHPSFIRFVASVIVRQALTIGNGCHCHEARLCIARIPEPANLVLREDPIAALLLAMPVTLAAVTVYVATAGLFPEWPDAQTQLYNLQADGFLDHQTSIKIAPSANLWDTSYYNGRNFIYWGPVPALMVAAVKLLAGSSNAIQDNVVATAFAVNS